MENIRVTVKYRMVYLNKYYNTFVLDHNCTSTVLIFMAVLIS